MSDQNTIDFDQQAPPEPMPQPTAPVQPTAVAADPGSEREVDPNEALSEAQGSEPTQAAPSQPAEPEDVVDVLTPKAEPRTWRFGPQGMELEYVQRPLSFVAKMQWFSLLGDVLDKAMSGPDGVSMNELLSAPGERGQQLSVADFRDADQFVRALGKVIVHAPKFLTDSFCIWMGVPDHQRRLVSEIMAAPVEEGGLTDEQGLEIIEVFIDQNYDAIADFFGGKIGQLARRVQARQEARKNGRK